MKKQRKALPIRALSIRALSGGVGLLTTLGLMSALTLGATANASATAKVTASASAKKAPHFRISAAQATAIVLKKFPGKITEKTRLEDEEGTWQYGVMVRSGRTLREVMVDAKTGVIANVEETTTGKEQVEKKTDAADEAKASKAKTDAAQTQAARANKPTAKAKK